MPRPSKGPRLYFRKTKGVYVILDGAHEEGTGCGKGDYSRAEIKLQEYLTKKRAAITASDSDPAEAAVAEILDYYGRHRAPKTSSGQVIASHFESLLPFWGDKHIPDLTPENCEAYVAWRTSQNSRVAKHKIKLVSIQTARRELATLQAASNFYHRRIFRRWGPVLELPDLAGPRDIWLTRAQVIAMLRAAREIGFKHVERFIYLALYTGSRHATITGLMWHPSPTNGWIDLENGLIYRMGRDERKTKKRRPIAKLPLILRGLLRRWHQEDLGGYQSQRMKLRGEAPRPISFVIHWRGKQARQIGHSFEIVARRAGLGPEITPHALRHTFATWAMKGKGDKWEVSGFAGMSLKTLESTYGHHHPDHQTGIEGALRRAK